MNEIVKSTDSQLVQLPPIARTALESLLPEQQALITAALQPKIKDLPALDAVTDFTTIITTIYTISGQQPETKQLALYADEFYTRLLQAYPSVTIEEVRAALRNGVYGEYGEFYGLNPKSFIQFIASYLNSEERRKAKQEFDDRRLLLSAPKPSPEAIYKENVSFIELLYSDYLKGKLLSDYIPGSAYDFLEAEGALILSLAEKKDISARAQSYYTRLKAAVKLSGGMADVLSGYLINTKQELTIKTISKQFAVYEYFERCKLEHKDAIFNTKTV